MHGSTAGLMARIGLTLFSCLSALIDTPSYAQSVVLQRHDVDQWRTNQIIVKWRAEGVAAVQMPKVTDRALRLMGATGVGLTQARHLYGTTDVMQLDHVPTRAGMQAILARVQADPAIEYAEPDGWRYLQADLPTDPRFYPGSDAIGSWVGQWYLLDTSSTTPSAISAVDAWKNLDANGAYLRGKGVVAAVIDTGVLQNHEDLTHNMLAPGYDFVSCDQGNFQATTTTAVGSTQGIDLCTASGSNATYILANNNGQNWHPDGDDPGDWIDANDVASPVLKNLGCTTVNASTWHGTKVAGVLGAPANGIGIIGVAPEVNMLSVRVTGKCAARVSDIAAGILWAGGQTLTVSTGTIAAQPPATILNLSLGSNSPCSKTEQDAITIVVDAGVLVIAAAGNEGGALDAPANCTNVVSVVGLRHTGSKAPFSSLSSTAAAATIAAPGGNCVNTAQTDPCLYDIESASDTSTTTPTATPDFYTYALLKQSYLNSGGNPENRANVGTSYSTPMVAGVAALMWQANPALTAGQLIARMKASALPFPTTSPGSSPNPGTCAIASTTADANGNFIEPTTPVECICTTDTCGAGMLNAAAAVQAATAAFVQIQTSSTTGHPGQKITLDGSGSTADAGHTIQSYLWSTIPPLDGQIVDPTAATTTLIVPSFRSIGVMLTITDDTGKTFSSTVNITSSLVASRGGALRPPWLVALTLLAAWQTQRRRRARN
jgi:serine protease